MPRTILTDLRTLTPGIGEEYNYLCKNIDTIKENKSNPNICNDALKSISGILSRCFGIKVESTILDTTWDNEFFGFNLYPDLKSVRSIVDITCDENADRIVVGADTFDKPVDAVKAIWCNIDEWHLDIDSKLFYSYSQRFNPREIIALLIYEIEKTIFNHEALITVFRAIKHMMLNVDYRTRCISKSTLCRNFYIIPFIQACGFVNYKSEPEDGSIFNLIPELKKDYLTVLTKLATQFTSSIIDKPEFELKQELSYILSWVMESVGDLKYHMHLLKKNLSEQIIAEKSFFVKNMLTSILNQFSNYDLQNAVNESYQIETPASKKLKEAQVIHDIQKKFDKVVEAAEGTLVDKLGRCKRVTQEEIDVLRIEIEKIETVDDKVYYMEKVYDKLNIVQYALDLIGNHMGTGKVRDTKATLLNQKEQLLQIREAIIAKQIVKQKLRLWVKYPEGYEG